MSYVIPSPDYRIELRVDRFVRKCVLLLVILCFATTVLRINARATIDMFPPPDKSNWLWSFLTQQVTVVSSRNDEVWQTRKRHLWQWMNEWGCCLLGCSRHASILPCAHYSKRSKKCCTLLLFRVQRRTVVGQTLKNYVVGNVVSDKLRLACALLRYIFHPSAFSRSLRRRHADWIYWDMINYKLWHYFLFSQICATSAWHHPVA